MKKLFTLGIVMASLMFIVPISEAKAAETANTIQQRRYRQERNRRQTYNNRRYHRGIRYSYQTRNVRRGYRIYRETYRITHFPNGRYRTQLVRRIRIR